MREAKDQYIEERQKMVEEQIWRRGINDERIIKAMAEVPRHAFVPADQRRYAYEDGPLPIGKGQTISQPYVVALMIEAITPKATDRVLEIGTGSGYAAAVLSRIVSRVYSVETVELLAKRAQEVINSLGYDNIELQIGDGSKGWREKAPFDAVMVSAGAPTVPESLIAQLSWGGRLVIPVGSRADQLLLRITLESDGVSVQEELGAVRFVPLLGSEGW